MTKNVSPALFSIGTYDSKFEGYYLDPLTNLWSTKTGSQRMISKDRTELNGFKVNIKHLILHVTVSKVWKDFIAQRTAKEDKKDQKAENTVPVTKDTFVIALIDGAGAPKFSTKPKVHATESEALQEIHRLATSFPGNKFAIFKCGGVAVASGITWS